MKEYLEPEICSKCGGFCCKTLPGGYLPTDFVGPLDLKESVRQALVDKLAVIDYWEGDPTGGDRNRAYYLRPPCVAYNLVDPAWGGVCAYLGHDGCVIKNKPAGCKLLEPKEDGECVLHGVSKQELAIAWLPHTSIIEALIGELS